MPSTGAEQQSFAEMVLRGIGAPLTSSNISSLVRWQQAEGGPMDNPLNTTLGQAGAQGSSIRGYGSAQAGADATIQTLLEPQYASVVNAFRKDAGFAGIGATIVDSPWDKNHYQGTTFLQSVDQAIVAKGPNWAPPLISGTAGQIARAVGIGGTIITAPFLGAGELASGETAAAEEAAGARAAAGGAAGSTLAKLIAAGGAGAAIAIIWGWLKSNWLRVVEFLGGVVLVVYGLVLAGKVGMAEG